MEQTFQVVVSSFVQSVGEWKRILEADDADTVSQLTEDERVIAKKLGVQESELVSKIKTGQYGQLRLRAKGLDLGERVTAILQALGSKYRLVAVLWEQSKARWVLRIEAADKIANVPIAAELADDVVETGSEQDLDRLKNLVLFGVGRQELIFPR
jgi:hypothetical protein